jgi:hypothetical protein
MTSMLVRTIATITACSLSFASVAQTLPQSASQLPPLIGTEQAAAPAQARVQIEQALARADVAAALQSRGVSLDAARARVAAMTDAEAALVAAEIDRAPAGGDVLGVLVTIFVLLLVTDILGLTKVFPFTRSVR